ncbi:MAG TPA: twin-arginine translocase TatA/TatE family subunit [Balneolales bacterium]|nr:twin-arginine translocase TatA/TatE family subunit [Balneolales bacterium]
MGDFGGLEWVVIVLVIVLLFGAKRIPELARGLGKGINEFKRATEDIKREIDYGANSVNESARQIDNEVRNTVKTSTETQTQPQSDAVSHKPENTDNDKNS